MSEIRIQLFGRFRAWQDGQIIAGLEADKLQKLFSYLLLYRRAAHTRESLACLLWPEMTTAHAKKRLRQVLWQLQSVLGSSAEASSDHLLLVTADQVQVNPEADLWLDVAAFEKTFAGLESIAGRQLEAPHVRALRNAIQWYRGPLLEGCYEDWCLYERERLQNMYLAMLEKLMNSCAEHHDYEAGIHYGMQILACDKVHERAYRGLMRLHSLSGNRDKALRVYEQCSLVLDEELGITPSQRTTAYYKRLLADHVSVAEPTRLPADMQSESANANTPLVEALHSLTQVEEVLTGLQRQVQHSMRHVEQLLGKNSCPPPSPNTGGRKDAQGTLQRRS
jgi:DNA-binding SARP family transcriptional activator